MNLVQLFRRRPRYYEIICQAGVIGVAADRVGGKEMIHAVQQDRVLAFGAISERDFRRFGDHPWTKPISTLRWKPTFKTVLSLELIL